MIQRLVVPARIALMILGIAALAPAARGADAKPPVTFAQSPGRVGIGVNGEPFATYIYDDPQIPRPYFMSLRAPGGIRVTRNQPPVAGQDLVDHPTFHPGLWLAFGDLSGADDWRLVAPVKHVEFIDAPTFETVDGKFSLRNRYLKSADGDEAICEEVFRCGVKSTASGTLLMWDSTFSSDHEFSFGDQEEMGLGIRVATAIRAQTQAEGDVAGGNGTILDAAGRKNEAEVWGNSAEWCDYSGVIDGQRVGLTIFCHPDNFRPSWFHARDRGLLEANPFGRAAFHKGELSKVVVKPGETLRLRYGILVHAVAADAAEPDLAAAYKDYVQFTSEK